MDALELPDKTQDHLKVIWDLSERLGAGSGNPVSLGDLSAALGQKASTTSEAVKRLARSGFVDYEPYVGVTLTDTGRAIAMQMVRRHRLLEMFLVQVLDYPWDEVHDEADLLEHGVSDRFLERIDTFLGHPRRDPHGDPIPDAHGYIEDLGSMRLNDVPPGAKAVVVCVSDARPSLLRRMARYGVRPGDTLVASDAPSDSRHRFHTDSGKVLILDADELDFITVAPFDVAQGDDFCEAEEELSP